MSSFIVFGAGRFGASVARSLSDLGAEVMIIDKNEDLIQEISNVVTSAVIADVMDQAALDELGVGNFDVCIVAIGDSLEASIVTTMYAKEKGVEKIVAKATSEMQGKLLHKLGADEIIYPEIDIGVRVAHRLFNRNIIDYIYYDSNYSIIEMKALDEWIDKSLIELDFRNKYKLSVIAVRRGEKFIVSPYASFKFMSGDKVIVIGEEDNLEEINKE
ncbi:MAG: TrkA family potassium uptake protein [Tissierellia bacterium]|nr:TrkA family potassium uptake protein [Tissierellia bacterium]